MRRLALAAFLALALVACKGDRALPAASAETPVIIVSIDTLRSDRLPAYGYEGVETPNIDAFRADSILYERAYSHYPLTFPSHASILTGLLPADHGVRDNTGYQLGTNVKTIQEILKDRGYATGAAVSSFILRRETGMNRGFDLYDDSVAPVTAGNRQIGSIQRDGSETVTAATSWLGQQTKPVFLLLHLYEPHTPYTAPEPYRSKYASKPYDGEVARVDEVFGTFVSSLKSSGLYDRALIILLSDHGEGLNDHGEEEHGMFLYREAIQVPLMVKLPESKLKGESVAAPVQLVDVVPTILERLGLEVPKNLPGRSLASIAVDEKPAKRAIYSESHYPRFHFGWAEQHSLIDGDHHYISSPRAELFHLANDFAEKTNILEEDRRTYFAMRNALQPMIREAAAPTAANAEEIAKLTALGYLGSTVQTRPGEVLPDPKDRIGDVAKVNDAFIRFQQRKYAEALTLLEPLLQQNPRMLDLWDLKSKTLARLGHRAEAVEAAKQGLRLSPNATHLAVDVATLQLDLGNLEDAEQHADLALKGNPGQAYEILARIWMARNDLPRAEAEARKSLENDRERAAPYITMARVHREMGKLDSALQLLNEAEKRKKPSQEIANLYFLRGDVHARLGNIEAAERDFRKEIATFPEEPQAYKNLVLLLVAGGRVREGTQLIRDLISASPVPASYVAVCEVLATLGDARGVKYWARQGLTRYPEDRVLRRFAA
jgi:arylsulfatase A-like enzyme/predicted Zn-dependent protease